MTMWTVVQYFTNSCFIGGCFDLTGRGVSFYIGLYWYIVAYRLFNSFDLNLKVVHWLIQEMCQPMRARCFFGVAVPDLEETTADHYY